MLDEGRVLPGLRQTDDAATRPPAHVRSGPDEPANTYAAVPYKAEAPRPYGA